MSIDPGHGYRLVDTETETFNPIAEYWSDYYHQWIPTANHSYKRWNVGCIYRVPIEPAMPDTETAFKVGDRLDGEAKD